MIYLPLYQKLKDALWLEREAESERGSGVCCIRMDMDHVKGSNVCDRAIGGMGNYQGTGKSSQMDSENKKTAVHAEMARVNKLPSNSSYATHRMKVLNKILHLLSIPRTVSQEEELELLFAGLSL